MIEISLKILIFLMNLRNVAMDIAFEINYYQF